MGRGLALAMASKGGLGGGLRLPPGLQGHGVQGGVMGLAPPVW